ncbi:hypothetical protein N0V83_006784 [Neocucurbitaria cava]|uniref:Gfd2/YDR514C-like C-terminal domain-containing protein n=1 Tax=Neocucurbitaria cava TaxID=798079 RepID=A0A9W8Y6S7_9PLEO|nr:hypothetical protein N0V83_006784 [Neocucurbitaria cava]
MDSQSTANSSQVAPAAASPQETDTLKQLRAFLSKHSDLDVLRHWSTDPLPGAPIILDEAVGVFPDLEWYDNSRMPNVPSKITKVGLTIFPMTALQQCKSPADFSTRIKQAEVFHLRILDNCHMRNKSHGFEDAEKNSLYCKTRFIAEDEVQQIFVDILNNQKTKDGSKAPVILVGHGWNHDEEQLKKHWKFNINKLDSVVYKVHTLAKPAQQAGIIPVPDRAAGQSNPKFDDMLAGFGIDLDGL